MRHTFWKSAHFIRLQTVHCDVQPACCCHQPTTCASGCICLQNVRVWHQLHRSRIGLVGAPSDWLVASAPSSEVVRAAWGPSLVDVDMQVGRGAGRGADMVGVRPCS